MSKPILWIVIPCYNEEQVLPITAPMFLQKITSLTEKGMISDKSRVLFVNDGSRDKTWELICGFAKQDAHFIGISQSRNRGHQNAVLAGLMEARANNCDITISIDCDGQDDINAMDEMVQKYLDGAEVVYGVRSRRDTDTFFKRFTAEGFYHLMNALGADIVFNHADYRLISARVLDSFADYKEVNIFLRGMVPLVGFQSEQVFYERHERLAGESHYPLPFQQAHPAHHRGRHRGQPHQLHRRDLGHRAGGHGQRGGRLGLHHLHRLLCGRRAAGLPGCHRRIHRQDLYGNKGPPALHHLGAHLGPL